MFKRMSVLEKRPGDDPAFFSRHWRERHGPLVARLPAIRSYVQNHVEVVYEPAPFRISGIVELGFDDAAAMDKAFTAERVRAVRADEPNFLGNTTGYVIGASRIRMAEEQGKLVLLLAHDGDRAGLEPIETALRRLPGFVQSIRDDVASTIPRPGSEGASQRVDSFFHLYFSDVAGADRAALQIAAMSEGTAKLGIVRVRTARIV